MKRFLLLLMLLFMLSACAVLPQKPELLPTQGSAVPVEPSNTPLHQVPTLVTSPIPATVNPAPQAGKGTLEGITWVLTLLEGEIPQGQGRLTVSFKNGNVGGNAGCNSFGGEYRVRGNTLSIGKLMSTLKACADDSVMTQEGRYLKLLGGAETFSVTASELRIQTEDGAELVFIPQE